MWYNAQKKNRFSPMGAQDATGEGFGHSTTAMRFASVPPFPQFRFLRRVLSMKQNPVAQENPNSTERTPPTSPPKDTGDATQKDAVIQELLQVP